LDKSVQGSIHIDGTHSKLWATNCLIHDIVKIHELDFYSIFLFFYDIAGKVSPGLLVYSQVKMDAPICQRLSSVESALPSAIADSIRSRKY